MLKVITQPSEEPLSLAEAKAHLRVDIDDDNADVALKLSAAREHCEGWTSRAFITTGFRLTLDRFPCRWIPGTPWVSLERVNPGTIDTIKIPRADLIEVSSITYVDLAGDVVTLDPSRYIVETGAPGRILPAWNRTWPTSRTQPGAVTIDFTAGYGDAASDVPALVKQAIALLLGDFYRTREASTPVALSEAPNGIQRLLAMADWGGGYQ